MFDKVVHPMLYILLDYTFQMDVYYSYTYKLQKLQKRCCSRVDELPQRIYFVQNYPKENIPCPKLPNTHCKNLLPPYLCHILQINCNKLFCLIWYITVRHDYIHNCYISVLRDEIHKCPTCFYIVVDAVILAIFMTKIIDLSGAIKQ